MGLIAFFSYACASIASAEDSQYRFGAGDQVRVAVFGRADLSGDFRVRSDGTLGLPLVGAVPAVNLTIRELESAVEAKLAGSSVSDASVNIEPLSLRPFFIIGDVTNPGAYPYVLGLRVVEAVALAGGYRVANTQSYADLEVLANQYRAAQARKARLEAEQISAPEIKFPDELLNEKENAFTKILLETETSLFHQRSDGLASTKAGLAEQMEHFKNEISTLNSIIKAQDDQIQLVKPQIDSMERLVSAGNASKSQLLGLQLIFGSVEERRLQAAASVTEAKEKISELKAQSDSTDNERREGILTQLAEAQQQVVDLQARLTAAKEFLSPLGDGGHRDAILQPRSNFVIVRRGDNGPAEINGNESTPVLPGDVIKIPIQ